MEGQEADFEMPEPRRDPDDGSEDELDEGTSSVVATMWKSSSFGRTRKSGDPNRVQSPRAAADSINPREPPITVPQAGKRSICMNSFICPYCDWYADVPPTARTAKNPTETVSIGV